MSDKLKEYQACLEDMERALNANDPVLVKKYAKIEQTISTELGSYVDDPNDSPFLVNRRKIFKEAPETIALRAPFKARNTRKVGLIVKGLSNADGTLAHTPEQEEAAMIRIAELWEEVDNDCK